MNIQTLRTTLCAAILACLSGSLAKADVYEISYTGTVTGVTANLSSGFSTGQTLSGSLLFESSTAPVSGGTVNSAVFEAVFSHSFGFSGGATSYSAIVPFGLVGKPEIQIDNAGGGFANDRLAMLSRASEGLSGASVGGLDLNVMAIRYDDFSNSVFSTALTLPTNLAFDDFDSGAFFMFFGSSFEGLVNGNMTSLSFSLSVPEPGMSGMMLALVVGLAARRRR